MTANNYGGYIQNSVVKKNCFFVKSKEPNDNFLHLIQHKKMGLWRGGTKTLMRCQDHHRVAPKKYMVEALHITVHFLNKNPYKYNKGHPTKGELIHEKAKGLASKMRSKLDQI